jgi:RNA polymerase sigma-70 factor (ECF subfamily)
VGDGDPGAKYTLKESVALAFVAALQCLTPPQRATLLLRDVLGLSAEETAEALGIGVGAANSALFRAREAVEQKIGPRDAAAVAAEQVDEALLTRYVRAFEAMDVDAFVALFHDDVVTTMPPSPTWVAGRAANEAFYRFMWASGRVSLLRIVPLRANGQAALGYYRRPTPEGTWTLHAIQVLTARERKIGRIDHFMTKESFPAFGIPLQVA